MTTTARRIGSEAETKVVGAFRRCFPTAERRVTNGAKDRGDMAGVPDLTCEIKGGKQLLLGPWMDEAEKERTNAGTTWTCVAHKRRLKGNADDWFVTIRLGDFVDLYSSYLEGRAR